MSKTAVLMVTLFSIQPVYAFDLFPVFGPPGQEKTKIHTGYTIEPEMELSEIVLSTPIHQSATEALSLSLYGQKTRTDSTTLLPSLTEVPRELYNFQAGVTYARYSSDPLARGRFWAVNGTFGSASDKPFARSGNNTIGGTVFYGFPTQAKGSWLFLLNYSNNRTILNNIPLPGFAYTFSPQPLMRVTLGLPFGFVWWRPSPKWTYTVFVIAPWFYNMGAEYELNSRLKLFSSFGVYQKPFLRDQRTVSENRLTYVEKKGLLGVKAPIGKAFEAQVSGGYSFDRIWYEAKRYSDRNSNSSRLGSGWIGTVSLDAKF